MASQLKHISNLSPVTALAFLDDQDSSNPAPKPRLLVGEGPFIKTLETLAATPGPPKRRIFSQERIHGISLSTAPQQKILLWGGRSICVAATPSLLDQSAVLQEIPVPDWVFYSLFVPSMTSASDVDAIVITAHNVLLRYNTTCSSWQELASGDRCMLYSAHLLHIPADTCNKQDRILVAAGTVFGEILIWSVSMNPSLGSQSPENPRTHYRLLGHEGSIFGVNISPKYHGHRRYLASCSDDRTVRIWDISRLDSSSHAQDATEIKKTGFGHQFEQRGECISIGWGHGARIWGVQFLPKPQNRLVKLLSVSEDLTSKFWSFDPWQTGDTKQIELKNIATYLLHSGKHIWAYALDLERGLLATGGADGRIGLVRYRDDQESQEEVWEMNTVLTHIRQASEESPPNEPRQNGTKAPDAFKEYAALDNDSFVATTTQGRALIYKISQKQWRLLGQWVGLKNWSILASWEDSGLIALGGRNGQVGVIEVVSGQEWWWESMAGEHGKVAGMFPARVGTGDEQKYYALTTSLSPSLFSLHSFKIGRSRSPPALTNRQTISLHSPAGPSEAKFLVTSLAIDPTTNHLFLGSRTGALGIYDLSSPTRPLPALSHISIHPQDAITTIIPLPINTILTTSRSGEYSHITLTPHPTKTHTSKTSLAAEGAHQDQGTLTLWGFHGKQFSIVNHTPPSSSPYEVHAVECGGAHRAWAHRLNNFFVWTKTGAAHIARTMPRRSILQPGLHGREIKAVAVHANLIATGAEDTLVRLSTLSADVLVPAAAVGTHTTGIHALRFSPCGMYLFSAGGAGELLIWRVRSASEVALHGTCPDTRSDLRIEAFDVTPCEVGFLVAVGYSDSAIRVYSYDIARHKFNVVVQGVHKACCILQVKFIPGGLLIAGTDGFIATYRLPADGRVLAGRVQEKRIHQNSIKALHSMHADGVLWVYTGGDDCALGITRIRDDVVESWVLPRAHASAVMAVLYLGDNRLLTAGVDQRVKLWEISEGGQGGGVGVRLMKEKESAVADISAAEAVGGGRVVIVGVGVDIWEASDRL